MNWGDRAAEQYEKDQPSGYAPCLLHEITNCSTCSGLDKKRDRERFELAMFPPRIDARHPGTCPKCEQSFDVGTSITMTMGQEWICCP